MKYWINYYDSKNHYTSKEIEASSLEELINTCMWDKNISEVVELVEDSCDVINLETLD